MTHLLDRRSFLRTVGVSVAGGALAAGACQPILATGSAEGPQTPKFRFVQCNDTHVQSPLRDCDGPQLQTYARANEKLQWCVETLNRELKPDFVLGLGDLIHGERLDRLPLDLEQFQTLTKSLQAPLYPTPGNHETVQQEGHPDYERAYRAVFGDDRVHYTFEHGGVRFILFNNGGAVVVGPQVVRARNDWLRQTLAKYPGQPKVLGCHIPVLPIRQESVLAKSFGFRSYQAHDPELLEVIDAHAASVVAVLSGHLHLTGCVIRKGVHHISISGTASYPSNFASFDVYEDRIEMRVQQLPAELAASSPSIHGRPRHPQDYLDEDHATAEAYQAGRPDERNLTIPISV
jgi:3',5'-cyclic AMP phosphodiesterase CpdA